MSVEPRNEPSKRRGYLEDRFPHVVAFPDDHVAFQQRAEAARWANEHLVYRTYLAHTVWKDGEEFWQWRFANLIDAVNFKLRWY